MTFLSIGDSAVLRCLVLTHIGNKLGPYKVAALETPPVDLRKLQESTQMQEMEQPRDIGALQKFETQIQDAEAADIDELAGLVAAVELER